MVLAHYKLIAVVESQILIVEHGMRFENVAIGSVGYTLPPVTVTSEEIEGRLSSVYERLKLPEGRLELMSGIRERRLWQPGTRISDPSIESCRRALAAAEISPSDVGCLIHASVCREFLEPATACRVHHGLGLPPECWVYDVSNACLGVLNGVVQIAQLIEAGVIRAGLVVGTENASGLIEATVADLLSNTSLTRQSIKPAFASLTIGSGSCAVLLVDRRRFRQGGPVHTAVARANTVHHGLCHSDQDLAGGSMMPIMHTDSEKLLEAGVQTGVDTFSTFLNECPWTKEEIDATVCHQVGLAHRRLMLDSLGLPQDRDFATFHALGNTGSVALPTALGIGLHSQAIRQPSRVALLGIGSGINCVMIAAEMDGVAVQGNLDSPLLSAKESTSGV
jgi:acyl-CoA:acyl-CoA alkyltransferase